MQYGFIRRLIILEADLRFLTISAIFETYGRLCIILIFLNNYETYYRLHYYVYLSTFHGQL